MYVVVKNNKQVVFLGPASRWLKDNQEDGEVKQMIRECRWKGRSQAHFLSGEWECIKLKKRVYNEYKKFAGNAGEF